MFKKLRNRLLVINTLIITALILGSFSLIYITASRDIERGIQAKLDRNVNFVHSKRMIKPPPNEKLRHDDEQDKAPFSLTFTVETNKNGEIEKVNMPFELNDDFYSTKMEKIIKETAVGEIKSDNAFWAYKTIEIDSGYVTAFTEIQSEHTMLRNLFLILLVIGLIAITLAFLIGFILANRSIRPIEDSYNKQKQFVADASHELKTPLTTINTNVDVLLSHPDSKIGEEKKWLEYIKTESERMTKLTNDLLYLARLDYNDDNVIMHRVSFSEAVESVILLIEAVIFENNVNLSYDIASDLYVNGSNGQLKQIVMILLDNAIKYTPETGDITIKLKQDSGDALLTVHNTGAGISEEAQTQIFERFYREDKSRARESGGHGLGLAIAKAVVKQCRGSIKVNSKKNEYAEFTVRIPLA